MIILLRRGGVFAFLARKRNSRKDKILTFGFDVINYYYHSALKFKFIIIARNLF